MDIVITRINSTRRYKLIKFAIAPCRAHAKSGKRIYIKKKTVIRDVYP